MTNLLRLPIWSFLCFALALALLSGCGDDAVAPDSIAPAAIDDLTALGKVDSSAVLSWTAPGDDGAEGTADRYEIRYRTGDTNVSDWWENATTALDPPRPGPAGVLESWTVRPLVPDSTYAFAIRAYDELGNESELSNLATVAVVGPEPPAVDDFELLEVTASQVRLRWRHPSPGDAPIEAYELRIAPAPLSEENWEEGELLTGLPMVGNTGQERQYLWTGLAANETWTVHLRTRAPGGRLSDIRIVSVATPTLHLRRAAELLPMSDLSAALQNAENNDILELGAGRFTGGANRNLEVEDLTITVRGMGDDRTIIDCEEQGRAWLFRSGATRIEGVTLRAGRAGAGNNFGGAVFCIGNTSPVFVNCVFEENTAFASGGAVAVSGGGTPRFEDCTFRENSAEDVGGALWIEGESDVEVVRCTFAQNTAGNSGGGIAFVGADGSVTQSRFESNQATEYGGALSTHSSSPLIEECVFAQNTAGKGGGAILVRETSAPNVTRSTFRQNTAVNWGGAVYCWQRTAPTFTESVFSENAAREGGAFLAWSGSTCTLNQCTIVLNNATNGGCVRAIGPDSGFNIRHSILALSTGGTAIHCQKDPVIDLECTVIFGNRSGDWTSCIEDQLDENGNFRADPRFCDFERSDFRLRFDSPCANREGCGTIGALGVGCTP